MKKIASTVILLLLCICYSHGQTLSVTLSATNYNGYQISCFGEKNGSLTATITGGTAPYAIEWSTGETTATIIELAAGYYIVRVSDSFGAEALAEITLTEPEPLQIGEMIPFVYPNGYNVSAFGACNGSVATTINGGTPPYTYEWVPGQQTILLPTNLCANENLLKVIDANGCGADKGLGLSEPERDDWQMTGNANTNATTQFMGTTDNKDFSIRTYNQERLRIMGNGDVKINSLAGTGNRFLSVDANGKLITIPLIVPICSTAPLVIAFQQSPFDPADVFTCWRRVAIGHFNPQERLDVQGMGRFCGWNTVTSYINIGHDGVDAQGQGGNSTINSYGNGNLEINNYSGKNVNICTSTNPGTVQVGGNTFLATGSGKNVGIGITNPNSAYKLDVAGDINATTLRINGTAINLATQWLTGTDPGEIHYDGGNVGIGIANPAEKLDVNGNLTINNYRLYLKSNDQNHGLSYYNSYAGTNIDGPVLFGFAGGALGSNQNGDNIALQWTSEGTVSIGGSSYVPAGYTLAVHGNIIAKDIMVHSDPWPDYVFKSGYKLKPLTELNTYIANNKHLPGIPAASEVETSGIALGEIVGKQMEKIEELTLYLIQLKQEIDDLKKENLEIKLKAKSK